MSVSWGPFRALGALLGTFLLAGGISGLLGMSPALSALLLGTLFIGVSLLLTRGNLQELGFRKPQGWALPSIVAFALWILLSAIYAALDPQINQDPLLRELGDLPVQIFLVVILAPLAEEIIFRGVLFAGFLRRMPLLLAAVFSALLFALPHLPGGIAILPLVFVAGFILALLFYRTGSLWPPIIVHALNNALVFLGP